MTRLISELGFAREAAWRYRGGVQQTNAWQSQSQHSSRPIRVLYVSPVGERGGAEVVLLNILKHHDRQRFTPMVCLLKEGPLVEEVRRLEVSTFTVPTTRLRYLAGTLRTIRQIRRLLREQDVDIVFSNMAMGHIYGGLAALGTSVKRAWFQHTISSGQAVDRLAALISADRLYVNSQASLRAMRRFHLRAKSIQVVYPGTETRFSCTPGVRSLLRGSFDIPDGAPVVAMVGRFQRGKGQHVFIEAAAAVCRQRPGAFFFVIGDTQFGLESDYKTVLEDLVRHYGLSRSVVFTGWRSDVPALLNAADVLVHPATMPESFGLVVLEAFFQGRPVVVTGQGGLTEIVADGETGFLVPPGDATALAEKILLLLSDENLRRQMGSRGRKLVLERFTMTRMIREMEDSYLQIMCDGPGTKAHR